MKAAFITSITKYIESQYLMRERDVKEFEQWLSAGNVDEDYNEAYTRAHKGERFDMKGAALRLYNTFLK